MLINRGIGSLLAFALVTGVAMAEEGRQVSKDYRGASVGTLAGCRTGEPPVGAACFQIGFEDTLASFVVNDDNVDWPIGGWYRFEHSVGFGASEFYPFCGSVQELPVERPLFSVDRVHLVVSLDLYYSSLYCTPGVPTTGTIVATFSQAKA